MPDKNETAGPIEVELMRVYDHQFPGFSLPQTFEVISRHLDAVNARLDAMASRIDKGLTRRNRTNDTKGSTDA